MTGAAAAVSTDMVLRLLRRRLGVLGFSSFSYSSSSVQACGREGAAAAAEAATAARGECRANAAVGDGPMVFGLSGAQLRGDSGDSGGVRARMRRG